ETGAIELDGLFVLVERAIEEGAVSANAGVVDQDLDGLSARGRTFKNLMGRFRSAKIDAVVLDVHAVLGLELLRELLEAILPTGNQDDVRAALRKLAGHVLANSAR